MEDIIMQLVKSIMDKDASTDDRMEIVDALCKEWNKIKRDELSRVTRALRKI